MSARYRIEASEGTWAEVRAGEAIVIGRSDRADLRLESESVALRHARLSVSGSEAELEVVRGEEARINGVTVTGKRVVRDGDELEVGEVALRFSRLADDDRPTPPPGAEPVLETKALARPVERAVGTPEATRQALTKARVWWPHSEIPPLEVQHVWFALDKDDSWRSLSIVPTDDRVPAAAIAHGFGRMASLNPNAQVLVIDATPGRAAPANAAESVGAAVTRLPGTNYDLLDASAVGLGDAELAHVYVPRLLSYLEEAGQKHDRVIIALGCVTEHPQSIPIARAVDAVVLAVGVGESQIPAVRQSAEIVGRERLKGSMVVQFS